MNQDTPQLSQSSQSSSASKQNKRSNFQFTYNSENYLLSLIHKYKEDIFTRGNRIKTWETVLSAFNEKYNAKIIQSRTINHRFQMLRKNLENKLMHENQPVQQLNLNENEKLLIDIMDYMYKNNYTTTDPFALTSDNNTTAGFPATRPTLETHELENSDKGTTTTAAASYKSGGKSGYTTGTSISSVSSSMITPTQGSHDASDYAGAADLLASSSQSVEHPNMIGSGSLSYNNRVSQARDPYILLHDVAASHQLQPNLYQLQPLFTQQEHPLNMSTTHQLNDGMHTDHSSGMFAGPNQNAQLTFQGLHSDSVASNHLPQNTMYSQHTEGTPTDFKTPFSKTASSGTSFPPQSSNQPRTRARHLSIATPQIQHSTFEPNQFSDEHFQQSGQENTLQSRTYSDPSLQSQSQAQLLGQSQAQQVRTLMQQQLQTQNATQAILQQILALQAQYKSEITSMREEIMNLREETTGKIDRILNHLDDKVAMSGERAVLSNQREHRTEALSLEQVQQQQQQQQQRNTVQLNPQANSSDEDMLFEGSGH